MSLPDAAVSAPAPENAAVAESTEIRPPVRSWRKKFRKMKMTFDRAMEESNSLYREEQKALSIAKRLQEQNDQILDLLLDVNDEVHIEPRMRFNLRSPSPSPSTSAEPSLEPDTGPVSLSALEKALPYTHLSPLALESHPELLDDHPLSYFDAAHEEEYLNALDATLAGPHRHPHEEGGGRPLRALERPIVTEKDISLRNPQSVTNWLRRNQPEVFLQDRYEERSAAKASRQAAAEAGTAPVVAAPSRKRASLAGVQTPTAPTAKAEEVVDEEAVVEAVPPPARASRRSKDDEAYRPKGGSSRAKRKREDGGEGGRAAKKKSRQSAVTVEDGDA